MKEITLEENEIKTLLKDVLAKHGITPDEITFKQKVQIFGKKRGLETYAVLTTHEPTLDFDALINKITTDEMQELDMTMDEAVKAIEDSKKILISQ